MANGEVTPPIVRPTGQRQSFVQHYWKAIGAGTVIAGVGFYIWYKHEKNKAAAAAATTPSTATPANDQQHHNKNQNSTVKQLEAYDDANIISLEQYIAAQNTTTTAAAGTPGAQGLTGPQGPAGPAGTPAAPPDNPVLSGQTQPGNFTAAQAAATQTGGQTVATTGQAGVDPTYQSSVIQPANKAPQPISALPVPVQVKPAPGTTAAKKTVTKPIAAPKVPVQVRGAR